MEGIIIVVCTIAILINLAAFLTLNMFRVWSSAILITLMTMILGMRVTTEVLKLNNDYAKNKRRFVFDIRITYDIETYIFCIVVVILFF